jgi:hypothetical protein
MPGPKALDVLVLFQRDTRRTQMVDGRRLHLGACEAAVVKAVIVGHCTSSSRATAGERRVTAGESPRLCVALALEAEAHR